MTQPFVRKLGPVGSRKPSPTQAYEPYGYEDEVRVQRSCTAELVHHRSHSFYYVWVLRNTRTSRKYTKKEEAIEAMRQQGFGAYIDLDGEKVKLPKP